MKNRFCIILFFFSFSIFSEDSKFSVPLRVEPVGVYTKIRVDAGASENRERNVYEREKQAYLEGELKFLNYFSVKLGTTKTQWERSGSKTLTELDRVNLGLKFAMEHSVGGGTFAWGGGVRGFDRQSQKVARDSVAPEMYLIRPHFNIGYKYNAFEIILNGHVQSETNRRFKEGSDEEFRRHYQVGVSISYGLTENFRVFLESELRRPYNERIDTKSKFWNIYPGLSYQIYQNGFLGLSLQFPVTPDRLMDRGVRISYFHIF
jgi:hypothetical protein